MLICASLFIRLLFYYWFEVEALAAKCVPCYSTEYCKDLCHISHSLLYFLSNLMWHILTCYSICWSFIAKFSLLTFLTSSVQTSHSFFACKTDRHVRIWQTTKITHFRDKMHVVYMCVCVCLLNAAIYFYILLFFFLLCSDRYLYLKIDRPCLCPVSAWYLFHHLLIYMTIGTYSLNVQWCCSFQNIFWKTLDYRIKRHFLGRVQLSLVSRHVSYRIFCLCVRTFCDRVSILRLLHSNRHSLSSSIRALEAWLSLSFGTRS